MTDTSLILQSPLDTHCQHLLEVLLEESIDARVGGAAYAWATELGVNLLLRDSVFEEFLRTADFQLVVGVDDITSPATLRALADIEATYAGLDVRAFMSEPREGLFHPKLAWFSRPSTGSLVVGSGNLTGGGLWGNCEAFTLSTMESATTRVIQDQWRAWRVANLSRLYTVLDPRVIARAEVNARRAWASRPSPGPRTEPPAAPRQVEPGAEVSVLVAEIPRSDVRWKQANFDRDNYENFFGAVVGTQRRVLFQEVRHDMRLGEVERRPSVQVVSHNWRFELNAASGLDYPDTGRPIGVFLRLRPRTILYLLSMPGDELHEELVQYLSNYPVPEGRMRRVRTDGPNLPELRAVTMLLAARSVAFRDEAAE